MVTNEAKIGMKEEKEYELNSLLKVQTNPKVNHYMGHSKYNFEFQFCKNQDRMNDLIYIVL